MQKDDNSLNTLIQDLTDGSDSHIENLHDLFIHFITSPPHDCNWTREKINEMSYTYHSLRDIVKELSRKEEAGKE